ncbi:hypothetical protein PG991_010091 [Apiospora marii]|uniref:Protein kinase domain-containing protein n=1 Tax=Apiospora marii TaxID=335849 RepID=A0ABR1RHF7_9PEZI
MADSGSGSDYDYTEDTMYEGGLPVIDQFTREEQLKKARRRAEARRAQYERDEQRRRRLRRDALISRFERKRQTTNWQYDLRAARLHHEVLDYFEWRHRFRYLKTMRGVRPNRGGGGVSLFAEIDGNLGGGGGEKRRVAVKYGILPQRLYDEIFWLQLFGKLEHVVNAVHLGDEEERRYLDMIEQARLEAEMEEGTVEKEDEEQDYMILDPEPIEDVDDPGQGAVDPIEQTADESASAFWDSILNNSFWNLNPMVLDQPEPSLVDPPSRPTIVLEYMESGNLHEFRKRMREAGVNPPNRFLWRVLRCLMRACAAMAWYEHYDMGERGREYTIDWEEPENVAHGSLDLSHLLIGALTPNDIDHGLIPVVKMCSFGETENLPDNSRGLRQNQYAIGRIIQTLALPASLTADREADGLLPLDLGRTEFTPGQSIDSCIHDEFIAAPHVSFELKDFVTFLMAANVEDMWLLDRLLQETVRLSSRTAAQDFEGQEVPPAETNEAIAQFVQDYMFNASANAPPLGAASGADDASEQGPLTGIFERTFGGFFGTGGNRGADDFDPASFEIPDLPVQPRPSGFVPPNPDRDARLIRRNLNWPDLDRKRRRRRGARPRRQA